MDGMVHVEYMPSAGGAKERNAMIIKGNNMEAFWSDRRISWKAKGILGYLLSRPDGFEVRMDDLKSRSKDRAEGTRSAIKELAIAGYAKLTTAQNGKRGGRILGRQWVIASTPEALKESGL